MAAKELTKVRSKFVDRVTTSLIKQLLDDLLEDGVLNDGQKDSVLEENSTTADKARSLIDMVKKKGDDASGKMIAHLQTRDPSLYAEMFPGQPAQPAAEPQKEQQWSTTLISTAKELDKVRRRFVDRVTTSLIKQLLDDLLEDGVLNDGQKDSVLEDNITRADKARSLIDMVKKKGDNASGKMIAHLQTGDPYLYEILFPHPAAEPQKEQQWSTTVISTSEDFWRQKKNDRDDFYPATKNSMLNRVALLITNIKFTELPHRNGAEKDEVNMEKLLRALGYEVVKHTNLTGKAIDDALNEFSKHPKLKETDSVLVVIMSHGKLGAVCGVDAKKKISDNETPDEFPINNIYKHLGSEKCPALLNKPKIIIIQACRGGEDGSVLVRDGADPAVVCDDAAAEENIEDDNSRYVIKEKDFISLLSCTPDTVSYRHTTHGAYLIQYVAEVFNSFAHKDDIEILFRRVMRRFEEFSIEDKRQMPTKDRCTLTRCFYFFPGL